VELLVAIGIIAVLIALLMPALRSAIGAARSAGCEANLRTIMQAAIMYSVDNEGDMVPANWYLDPYSNPSPVSVGYPTFWWQAPPSDAVFLGKYTDNQNVTFDGSTNVFGTIARRNSVWNCPEKTWGQPQLSTFDPTNVQSSYAMDEDGEFSTSISTETGPVIAAQQNSGNTGWEQEYKLARVQSPNRMMSFVCSTCERFIPWGAYWGNPGGLPDPTNWTGGTPGCIENLALRHPNNSTNVAFMDGHVENIPASIYNNGSCSGLSLYPALNHEFVAHPTD
jgi:prepilin-type processing-associated H-X9-DG protein